MLRGILLFVAALGAAPVQAEGPDPLRKGAPIPEPIPPERIFTVEDRSLRRERAYPMQPPTIPHQIDHYQVDRYANKCLTCHSRHRVQEAHERYLGGMDPTGAPVSTATRASPTNCRRWTRSKGSRALWSRCAPARAVEPNGREDRLNARPGRPRRG